MKNLLTVEAVAEVATGLMLVALPSHLTTLLLDSSLDTPIALSIARMFGVALLALGVGCWLARHDGQSRAARGLVGAMVLHNVAIAIILVYSGIALGLSGIGLWPVILFHVAMAVWCVMNLLNKPMQ